jgi:hypothetical protein
MFIVKSFIARQEAFIRRYCALKRSNKRAPFFLKNRAILSLPPEQSVKLTFHEEHFTRFSPDRKAATKGGSLTRFL